MRRDDAGAQRLTLPRFFARLAQPMDDGGGRAAREGSLEKGESRRRRRGEKGERRRRRRMESRLTSGEDRDAAGGGYFFRLFLDFFIRGRCRLMRDSNFATGGESCATEEQGRKGERRRTGTEYSVRSRSVCSTVSQQSRAREEAIAVPGAARERRGGAARERRREKGERGAARERSGERGERRRRRRIESRLKSGEDCDAAREQ